MNSDAQRNTATTDGMCPICNTKTVEHNGGQWCPLCGVFTTPPDPRHTAHVRSAEPEPTVSNKPPNARQTKRLLPRVIWLLVFIPLMAASLATSVFSWARLNPFSLDDKLWAEVRAIPDGKGCFRCGKVPATRTVQYSNGGTRQYCSSCEPYETIRRNDPGRSERFEKSFAAGFVTLLALMIACIVQGSLLFVPFKLANISSEHLFRSTSQQHKPDTRTREGGTPRWLIIAAIGIGIVLLWALDKYVFHN